MIWFLLLFSTSSHAEDNLYLMNSNAYAIECSPHSSCVRESENLMLQIPLEIRSNGTSSGAFSDFSHLPTGELFTYELVAVESAKKIQITMNCKLESNSGELIYQCPTKINTARTRAELKKFNFVDEVNFSGQRFTVQINYSSAQ